MKIRSPQLSTLVTVVACVLSGCATAPQNGVEGGAAEVKIYGSDQITASEYEVVGRIWVDSWRSAFRLPAYPSEAEAKASLQAEAARRGADGLINVFCSDLGHSKWAWSSGPAVLCYGNAIRVRRS
jgi:hypothetical protein